MKKPILTFITALLIGQVFAQVNEFNLSDYKLPDLKRKQLDIGFDAGGQNFFYKTNSSYNSVHNKNDQNNDNYSGNINLKYASFLNNSTTQRILNSDIYMGYEYKNSKINDTIIDRNYHINPTINFSFTNRIYNSNNKFIETDMNLLYNFYSNYNYGERPTTGSSEYYSGNHNISFSLPIKIGTGRIDQVQDARHAIYLVDELKKQNRIKGDKNKEDLLAFASLISKIKNERFFDSRVRKIYEIETLDSFLIANNYISTADARYFTTLNDFWDYGSTPTRNSGSRLSLSLIPGYFANYNNYKDKNQNIETTAKNNFYLYNIQGGAEYIREKPISLKWQNTMELNAYAGIIDGKSSNADTLLNKIKIPDFQAGYKQTIGFYPNTRTEMTYSYGINYMQLFGKNDSVNDIAGIEGKLIKAFSELSINYYLSPKLRISLSSYLEYCWADTKNQQFDGSYYNGLNSLFTNQLRTLSTYNGNSITTNRFNHVFQFKLTYSIF